MRLPNLTIEVGEQISNVIDLLGLSTGVLYNDPGPYTGVITFQVSPGGLTWYNVVNLTAGAQTSLQVLHAEKGRLSSASPEAAQRVFKIHASSLDVA